MSNEVEIVVTSTDRTDFAPVHTKAKSAGDKLKETLTKAGGDSASGFGLQFSSRIGPLLTKAPIGPGLIAAVGAAAPAITATIATTITAGAGIGAVALGAAISAQDPRVKAGIDSLTSYMMSELRQSAQPFVPAMLDAIDKGKVAFRTLRPELESIFAKSATYLDPLTDGLIGLVENALPGFRRLVDAAEPLVDILGEELPEIGEDLANLFDALADSAGRNEDEFRAILDTVGLIVTQVGSMVTLMDYMAAGPTRTFLDLLKQSSDEIEGAKWVDPIEETTRAFEDQNEALKEARDVATEFADAMDRITDQNLSLAEANLKLQDVIDDTVKAMDNKTAVSRDEEKALLDIARASNDVIRALEETGASSERLAGEQESLRDNFIAAATQMGYNQREAERLADEYLAIPRNVRTNVQANTDDARRRIREYKELLASVSRSINTNFNAGTVYRGLAHGGISGAHDGGLRSDLTMVGEHGPELLDLPPGTQVHSNPDTQRMMAGGMGAGPMVIEVQPAPGANQELMNAIVKGLIFTIRTQGNSDPQRFLSGGRG